MRVSQLIKLYTFSGDACVWSVMSDSAAPWAIAHQAPLSVEFSRQQSCSRLPFPTPGDVPDPGTKPESLASPALAGGFFTAAPADNAVYRMSLISQ